MLQSMIRVEKLCKSVPTTEGVLEILRDVDLEIDAADTVAIVGASGSGKSTLLGLMAGLDAASSGDVFFQATAWLRWMKKQEQFFVGS